MYKVGSLVIHQDNHNHIDSCGYIYRVRDRIYDIYWTDGTSSWYSENEIKELISIHRLEVYE